MFYKAQKDMIERKDLSDSEKMLIMVLQGLSERQGYCFATNAKLAAMVGWSVDKLRNNLCTLGEKGIVAYELEDGNRRKLTLPQGGVQFHTEGGVQNNTGGCEDLDRGVCNSAQGGVQNNPPLHKRTINRTVNKTSNREERADAPAPKDEVIQVEEYTPSDNQPQEKEKVAPKRKVFTPPTIEELREFFAEVNMIYEADKFFDYYTANGWMVGKVKMKDWKATARNWARRKQEYSQSKPQSNGKPFADLTPERFYDSIDRHLEKKRQNRANGHG